MRPFFVNLDINFIVTIFVKKFISDQRSHIFDAMAEHNFEKGEVIIKQGDPGDYFYVIGKSKI